MGSVYSPELGAQKMMDNLSYIMERIIFALVVLTVGLAWPGVLAQGPY